MYSTSSLPSLYAQSQYYTPSKPSPLSSSPLRNNNSPPSTSPLQERDTNVLSSPPRFSTNFNAGKDHDGMSSSPSRPSYTNLATANGKMKQRQNLMVTPPSQNNHERNKNTTYSKRATKPNPLFSSSRSGSGDEGRETRRKLFLKRVREKADDKRFKARGIAGEEGEKEEEVLRCIWMQEERSREERRRREAAVTVFGEIDVDNEFHEEDEANLDERMAANLDDMMADEVAREEERELQEYLEMIPDATPNHYPGDSETMMFDSQDTNAQQRVPTLSRTESFYGSDDEYDEIFMDVIEEEQRTSSPSMQQQQQLSRQAIPAYMEEDEMMDMS